MDIKKLHYQSQKIMILILEIKALSMIINHAYINDYPNIHKYNLPTVSDMLTKRVDVLSKIFDKHNLEIDIAAVKRLSA